MLFRRQVRAGSEATVRRFFTPSGSSKRLDGRSPDELDGDVRFEVVEFIVHGLDRDGDVVLMFLVGVMDGGGGFEDDFEHEGHERGEEEFALILLLGGLFEEPVELLGREESLENGTDEDGE